MGRDSALEHPGGGKGSWLDHQKEMTKAQEEIAKGHFDHVVDKYRKAWETAVKA